MQSKSKRDLKLPVEPEINDFFELYKNYLSGAADKKVFNYIKNPEVKDKLSNLINEKGSGSKAVLDLMEKFVIEHSMNLQSSMYMGHQVPPTLPLAVMIDLLVSGMNQSLAVNKMSPVLSEIERQLLTFLCNKIGYNPKSGGTVTSGGSISNLIGVFGARKKYFPYAIPDNAVILSSNQCHFSIKKAANVLGFNKNSVVAVDCDEKYCIDVNKAESIIKDLIMKGKKPFIISANAGSTATGSFDNIDALADIAEKYDLWLHIDGAHGASLVLSNALKSKVKGIEKADSISWDGHKMLFMPSSIGICLFKDEQNLRDCFKEEFAPYLYNSPETALDLSKMSIQCTKRGDALKLWGSFVAYGTDFFAERLEHLADVTEYFYNRIRKHKYLEPLHKPEFNIFCFRYNSFNDSISEDNLNSINSQLRESLDNSGNVMITLTSLEGKMTLRTTIINPSTDYCHIDNLISLIESEVEHL